MSYDTDFTTSTPACRRHPPIEKNGIEISWKKQMPRLGSSNGIAAGASRHEAGFVVRAHMINQYWLPI